ncbi:MAG: efflux RND transporter periplasmic adaptor subunit [Candidatus Omnitrophica bacterium]|nr:efflux RND transporter periplasmic adaptor subunit [Candidatus Omnitrophota bacterium]
MIKFIKKIIWLLIILGLVFGGWKYLHSKKNTKNKEEITRINPTYGKIKQTVTTTGTVKPQNRLEIKSSIAGRIEKIFFEEGEMVHSGDILALLSSVERSSLLDAAKIKGKETLSYWEDVYKPIPLVSPIDGEVIARTFEPGQSVTTTDPILVLSDRLIVVSQVDETDIGYVKQGQRALLKLDAYPDIEVLGTVSHISFESLLINNVTIYEVSIIPDEIPNVFRSGMSANVNIIREQKENILLLPSYVIQIGKDGQAFVMLEGPDGVKEKTRITAGISDEENTEIVSGLTDKDTVLWSEESKRKLTQSRKSGTNPFMPERRRNNR